MPLYRNRVAALLAIVAVALNALWPLVAQAKPRLPGVLVPLCAIEGVTHYLELPPGKSPLEESSSWHHEHCQLCVFGADRVAVLPLAAAPLLVGEVAAHSLACVDTAAQRLAFHPPAQPRAPPAVL